MDCSDDFIVTYLSKFIKLCTFNVCSLSYVNYTSIKQFGWMDGWMDKWMDREVDRWTDEGCAGISTMLLME